ncbi:MAG: DUF3052 domain-containing protein [Ponticaulis sp.]|nr:DUF3052 domain-containing protein [Ponticaulis sp.]|tara:strand:+ start:6858 stop:7262 length:405 start_codon:yes stop_codon:yes gene_type:complete
MPQTHGYSGKPLFQKLGMKPGFRVLPINAPDQYSDLVSDAEGVSFVDQGPAELVHLFCAHRAELEAGYQSALDQVEPGGMLWVSWPKKSSKLFVDVTEDDLRTIILPTGWVDVKVCAVDADWSGLKFLKRKAKK